MAKKKKGSKSNSAKKKSTKAKLKSRKPPKIADDNQTEQKAIADSDPVTQFGKAQAAREKLRPKAAPPGTIGVEAPGGGIPTGAHTLTFEGIRAREAERAKTPGKKYAGINVPGIKKSNIGEDTDSAASIAPPISLPAKSERRDVVPKAKLAVLSGDDGLIPGLPPRLQKHVEEKYMGEIRSLRDRIDELYLAQADIAREKHATEDELKIIYGCLPGESKRIKSEISRFERAISQLDNQTENGSIERTLDIFRGVMKNYCRRSPSAVASGKSMNYEGTSFLDDIPTLERAAENEGKGIDTARTLWGQKFDAVQQRVSARLASKGDSEDQVQFAHILVEEEPDGFSRLNVEYKGSSYSFSDAFNQLKKLLIESKKAKDIESSRLQEIIQNQSSEALANAGDLKVGESTEVMSQADVEKRIEKAVPEDIQTSIKELIRAMKRAPDTVSYSSTILSRGKRATRFVHRGDFLREYKLLYTSKGMSDSKVFDIFAHKYALAVAYGLDPKEEGVLDGIEIEVEKLKAKLSPQQFQDLVREIPYVLQKNHELERRHTDDDKAIQRKTDDVVSANEIIEHLQTRLGNFDANAAELQKVRSELASLNLDFVQKEHDMKDLESVLARSGSKAIAAAERAKDKHYKARIRELEKDYKKKIEEIETTNKELRAKRRHKRFEEDAKDTEAYKLGRADAEAVARKKYDGSDRRIVKLEKERDEKLAKVSELEGIINEAEVAFQEFVDDEGKYKTRIEGLTKERDKIREDLDKLRKQQEHFLGVTFPEKVDEYKQKIRRKFKARWKTIAKRAKRVGREEGKKEGQLAMRKYILSGNHPCLTTTSDKKRAVDYAQNAILKSILSGDHTCFTTIPDREKKVAYAQKVMRAGILSGNHPCLTTISDRERAVDYAQIAMRDSIIAGDTLCFATSYSMQDALKLQKASERQRARKLAERYSDIILASAEAEFQKEGSDLWADIEQLCNEIAELEKGAIYDKNVRIPEIIKSAKQGRRRLAKRYGASLKKAYDTQSREATKRLDELYVAEKEKRRTEFIDEMRIATAKARLRQYIEDAHAEDERTGSDSSKSRISEFEQELAAEKAKPRQPAQPSEPTTSSTEEGQLRQPKASRRPAQLKIPGLGDIYNFFNTLGLDGASISPEEKRVLGPGGRPGINYSLGWRPWTPAEAAKEMDAYYKTGPGASKTPSSSSQTGLDEILVGKSSTSSNVSSAQTAFYKAQWEREDKHYESAMGMIANLIQSGEFKKPDLLDCETGINLIMMGQLDVALPVFEQLLQMKGASEDSIALANNNIKYILLKKGNKRHKDFTALKDGENQNITLYDVPKEEPAAKAA